MPSHQRYNTNVLVTSWRIMTPNTNSTTASNRTSRIILWQEDPIHFPNCSRHTTMLSIGRMTSHDPMRFVCPKSILLSASSAGAGIDLRVFSLYCRPKKHASAYATCSFRPSSLYCRYCTFQLLPMTFEPSGKKEIHQKAMTPKLVSLCAGNQVSCVSSPRCFLPL